MNKKKNKFKVLIFVIGGIILWISIFLGYVLFIEPLFESIGKWLRFPLLILWIWLPLKMIDSKSEIVNL